MSSASISCKPLHGIFTRASPSLLRQLRTQTDHHRPTTSGITTPAISVSTHQQHHLHTSPSSASSPRSFPAWFARGGTSNGLVIRRDDLPPQDQWHKVLPAAMGSPDAYGRQLDGMGSGVSSTSKIVVLSRPSCEDVDVEFTFVQVGIRDGALDMAGNCGNMSSIVGPAAWDQGMLASSESAVAVELDEDGEQWANVRILNTNTSKILCSRFKVASSPLMYCPDGDYAMDGVSGTNSKITMSFMDPAGAKTGRALPTGNPIDLLTLPNGSTIPASLVDVSNPGVFISTQDLNLDASTIAALTPDTVESNPALKSHLEQIRRAGATMMGLDPDIQSVPKIVLLFPPSSSSPSQDVDIKCLALSMGQPHKAVPLTLALCLGAASQLEGTIAAKLVGGRVLETVVLGHPSGKVDVGTVVRGGKVVEARLLRTARVLMRGEVFY